jgi:hypothetical protein
MDKNNDHIYFLLRLKNLNELQEYYVSDFEAVYDCKTISDHI